MSLFNGRTKAAIYEVRRLLVPIVALLVSTFLLDWYGVQNQWALRLHKVNQVMFYVVLGHMIRSQIFPYIDLKTMYEDQHPGFGYIFIGLMLLMAAIILGGTLGL
jgi:hypothetical protein